MTDRRLYSLDLLRGIASLGIVFWHWQHFFYSGTVPGSPHFEALPLYSVLYVLYRKGYYAVDLFFVLSGFVFYWLYASAIARWRIGAWRFGVLRFSRLYPLHVATLVIVALLQLHGDHVFPYNDAKHFGLNLAFASSWGFEDGYSFNGPTWSVSVEVLLYAVFFAVCRFLPARVIVLLAAMGAGLLLWRVYQPVGRGVTSFFLGGLCYMAFVRIGAARAARRITLLAAGAAAIAWGLTLAVCHPSVALVTPWWIRFAWPTLILLPLTVLAAALLEREFPLSPRLGFFGEISYSTYLLHFPLQLAIIVSGVALDFYSWRTMAGFFVILVASAWASYHFFELPLQQSLRRRLTEHPDLEARDAQAPRRA